MEKRHVLVTGGAGFIGTHLVNRLIKMEYQVIVLDNLMRGSYENISDFAFFHNGDVSYRNDVDDVFDMYKGLIGTVYHLAAYVNLQESMKCPAIDAKNNIVGTLNVLSAAKEYEVERLIFSSSAAVYGTPQYVPVDEKHPTCPDSPYGLSKLTSEKYIDLMGDPLETVIMRFGNIYGPGQILDESGEGAVIPIFIEKLSAGKKPELRGNGIMVRDFIYVEDLVDALVLGLRAPSGTYNIGTGTGKKVSDLWDKLSGSASKYLVNIPEPIYVDAMPGEIEHMVLDNNKIRSLGWKPVTNFEDGISRTIDSHFKNLKELEI